MFPPQIMDKLLKLKLELAYKDLAVDQARQLFEEMKKPTEASSTAAPAIKKRKRILAKKSK